MFLNFSSQVCLGYAEQLKKSLAPENDPCVNFYLVACGSLHKSGKVLNVPAQANKILTVLPTVS